MADEVVVVNDEERRLTDGELARLAAGLLCGQGLQDVTLRLLAAELLTARVTLRELGAAAPTLEDRPLSFSSADPCPICGGEHDRIDRRDWDGCGGDCGPCPAGEGGGG